MHFFFAWLCNAQNVANVIQFQITKMTSLQKGESTKNSITISNNTIHRNDDYISEFNR